MSDLRFPIELDVGAATHTGCVRTANEDDYLVVAGAQPDDWRRDGVLLAVADGMGGLRGGAEASRAAIRQLGALWLESGDAPPAEGDDPEGGLAEQAARLRAGFDAASARVHQLAQSSPGLREMGTTLTALVVRGDQALLGHVGDSRCVRLRRGLAQQLTVDHVVAGSRNLLTRCIGAGQLREQVDLVPVEVQARDVFVLCSDGVWSLLEDVELVHAARRGRAQAVAERLVRLAVQRGAPDNCTAVVLRVRDAHPPSGRSHELDLGIGELEIDGSGAGRRGRSLVAPVWPFAVIALGLALLSMAVVRGLRDGAVPDWLRAWWG